MLCFNVNVTIYLHPVYSPGFRFSFFLFFDPSSINAATAGRWARLAAARFGRLHPWILIIVFFVLFFEFDPNSKHWGTGGGWP